MSTKIYPSQLAAVGSTNHLMKYMVKYRFTIVDASERNAVNSSPKNSLLISKY